MKQSTYFGKIDTPWHTPFPAISVEELDHPRLNSKPGSILSKPSVAPLSECVKFYQELFELVNILLGQMFALPLTQTLIL